MMQRLSLPRLGDQSPAIRRYTLMVFVLLTAFGASDLLFNLYLTRLGYREDFIGLVNAVTQLVWAGAAATAGVLTQRWTARRVLIAGAVVLAAGYGVRTGMDAPWAIIAAAAVGSIGGGWIFAIGMVYIAEYTQPETRIGAIALYSMASSLATTLGSVGGGWLPRLFAVAGIGESEGVAPLRATMYLGAGLIALSIVPLLGIGPPPDALPAPAVAPDLSLAGTRRTPRQQTRRDVTVYFVYVFLLASAVAMVLPFYNVYLARNGLSTGAIGLVYGAGGVVGAIFGLAVPWLGGRLGAARGAGILRSVPGVLFVALVFVSPVWLAAAAHIVRRGCFDAAYALESNMATRLFPAPVRANVFAWREAVLSLGIALLSPVGGVLIVRYGYGAGFSFFAVLTAVMATLFLVYFVPRERAAQDTQH